MKNSYVVPLDLQQFLTSLPSASLSNIVWNLQVPGNSLVLPFNPNATRRMLAFSKSEPSEEATPYRSYNCRLLSLDGSVDDQITFARGIED